MTFPKISKNDVISHFAVSILENSLHSRGIDSSSLLTWTLACGNPTTCFLENFPTLQVKCRLNKSVSDIENNWNVRQNFLLSIFDGFWLRCCWPGMNETCKKYYNFCFAWTLNAISIRENATLLSTNRFLNDKAKNKTSLIWCEVVSSFIYIVLYSHIFLFMFLVNIICNSMEILCYSFVSSLQS